MRKIELELTTLYLPDQVEQLKAAQAAGDDKKLEELANKISNTRLVVQSVKASRPMFDFSSPKDVVLEVVYTLEDGSAEAEPQLEYYLFEHHSLTGHWRYIRTSSKVSYYLNFL
jgi:hypothetical protein